MKIFKSGAIAFCCSLLISCGGGSSETSEPQTYAKIVTNSSSITESSLNKLSVTTNLDDIYTVTWSQESGPKTYFFVNADNTLSFIAPNVTEDAQIVFTANLSADGKSSLIAKAPLTITNTVVPRINEMPKPNVFASSNYTKHYIREFDSAGIPLLERENNEFYYYPVTIAAYGYDLYRALYDFHLSKGEENAEIQGKLIAVANWLRDNCVYTDYGFCSYRSYFKYDAYKLDTDWTTAMGQGQAISVLVAAHYLTGDESYGQVAHDALSAFLYPLEVKGLTADFEGDVWYEEYGSVEMPNHILNGFLFALSGIYDFTRNYHDELSVDIFNTGVTSLVNKIDKFDWHFTSRYSYGPLFQLASTLKGPDAYHELHVYQLAWLYNLTREEKIKEYTAKFLAQDMAGLKMINKFYPGTTKILNVEASSTINSTNFGPDRLFDGYWSIRNYWSSYRFPVDLTISLADNFVDAGVLNKLVLTSTTPEDFPTSFTLLEVLDSGEERVLKENITKENTEHIEYFHEVDVHKSYTVTFTLDIPTTSNTLKLIIYGTNEGLVRLRELDIQYPREALLEKTIDVYTKKL